MVAPIYDYLIKVPDSAKVHTGERFLPRAVDIGIKSGRIKSMRRNIPYSQVKGGKENTLQVEAGARVGPGLVDCHIHAAGHYRVDKNVPKHTTYRGATCNIDAGSNGPDNYDSDFVANIVNGDDVDGNFYGMVNIAPKGLNNRRKENHNFRRKGHDPEKTADAIKAHPSAIAAKVRIGLTRGNTVAQVYEKDWREVFSMSVRAAALAGTPLMVHVAQGPPLLEVLKEYERARNGPNEPLLIVTHCFHGFDGNIAEYSMEELKLIDELGVLLDVGHGQGGLSYPVAQNALERGIDFWSISSDLHHYNKDVRGRRGIVGDMPRTMSKFLNLRVQEDDVIRMSSLNPAIAFGLDDRHGKLEVGRDADITILGLKQYELGEGPRFADHRPADDCTPVYEWNAAQEYEVQNVILGGKKIV